MSVFNQRPHFQLKCCLFLKTANSLPVGGSHLNNTNNQQQTPDQKIAKSRLHVLGIDAEIDPAIGKKLKRGIYTSDRIHSLVMGFPGCGKTRFLLSQIKQHLTNNEVAWEASELLLPVLFQPPRPKRNVKVSCSFRFPAAKISKHKHHHTNPSESYNDTQHKQPTTFDA